MTAVEYNSKQKRVHSKFLLSETLWFRGSETTKESLQHQQAGQAEVFQPNICIMSNKIVLL